jgi:hypothetical protein
MVSEAHGRVGATSALEVISSGLAKGMRSAKAKTHGLPGFCAIKLRANYDRRATLAERRLSLRLIRLWRKRDCALKMPAGRVADEISCAKVKHRAERQAQNETFAPVPSFSVLVL